MIWLVMNCISRNIYMYILEHTHTNKEIKQQQQQQRQPQGLILWFVCKLYSGYKQ